MKDKALRSLQQERFCVLSTVSTNGQPESAFVGFSVNNELEIMIGTSKESRKYQNIMHNPLVSIVFGFDGKKTLQYEGSARFLEGKELENRLREHLSKNPNSIKYQTDPNNVYMIVELTWMRITASGPTAVDEMRFDS